MSRKELTADELELREKLAKQYDFGKVADPNSLSLVAAMPVPKRYGMMGYLRRRLDGQAGDLTQLAYRAWCAGNPDYVRRRLPDTWDRITALLSHADLTEQVRNTLLKVWFGSAPRGVAELTLGRAAVDIVRKNAEPAGDDAVGVRDLVVATVVRLPDTPTGQPMGHELSLSPIVPSENGTLVCRRTQLSTVAGNGLAPLLLSKDRYASVAFRLLRLMETGTTARDVIEWPNVYAVAPAESVARQASTPGMEALALEEVMNWQSEARPQTWHVPVVPKVFGSAAGSDFPISTLQAARRRAGASWDEVCASVRDFYAPEVDGEVLAPVSLLGDHTKISRYMIDAASWRPQLVAIDAVAGVSTEWLWELI